MVKFQACHTPIRLIRGTTLAQKLIEENIYFRAFGADLQAEAGCGLGLLLFRV
jgi:hypothetical protein